METATSSSAVSVSNVTPVKTRRVKCVVCETEFEAVSKLAKTCTDACRQQKFRNEKKSFREKQALILRELNRLSGELASSADLVRGVGFHEIADKILEAVGKMEELNG